MKSFWQMSDLEPAAASPLASEEQPLLPDEAEAILASLANTYSGVTVEIPGTWHHFVQPPEEQATSTGQLPNLEAKYRALLEQLPAVVFMAYLDRGIGEAYVSPQI